ncbi:MAG: leucine-rich repeat protein [Clostridia bacterium]|nr:leucine-rich repeat protein [Clostridia bacterium]
MTLFKHACYDNKKSLTRRTETLRKEEPNMKIRIAALTALILIVSFAALAAPQKGVFDGSLLINWTDGVFREAFGVDAKGFVPSDPQPLTYVAACVPVIDPMTGKESEIGWSEKHRSEPLTAENVLQVAGDLSVFSLTLTDDPNQATYYAVLRYKYEPFGKIPNTKVPLYKGHQTLTLKNMVTGETAKADRDIWFESEVAVSIFNECVGKEMYAGPTSWTQEDVSAFNDLLGFGLSGLYDTFDDASGGVCIRKYLGKEKKSLVVPDILDGKPVTGIGSGAFSGGEFTSVSLPVTVTHIDEYAFGDCSRLTSIEIPASTASISDRAFIGCGLRKIALPDGLSELGSGVFSGCKALSEAHLPSGLKAIPKALFYGAALSSVEIPEAVTEIGEAAFSSCEKLRTVALPQGVRTIGERAFDGCKSLKELTCAGRIESVGDSAFSNCEKLSSVHFADGVGSVGKHAFTRCEKLKKIDLNGLQSLGDSVFYSAFALESVFLPETLTTIGEHPFGDPRSDSKWEAVPKKLVLTVAANSYCEQWAQREGIPYTAAVPPTEEEHASRRYPSLKTGSKGDDVRRLQQKLIESGYLQGTADGSYGSKTAAAVSAAQSDFDMATDGVASAPFQMKLFGDN